MNIVVVIGPTTLLVSSLILTSCANTTIEPSVVTGVDGRSLRALMCGADSVVYDGLFPVCVGCHGEGANLPLFSSLDSFRALVGSYVTPFDGANSYLTKLLSATAQGSFTQMPLGSLSYDGYVSAGVTTLTITDVSEWIDNGASGVGVSSTEYRHEPTLTRLSARDLMNAVDDTLGLTIDDTIQTGNGYTGKQDTFPIFDPDAEAPWSNQTTGMTFPSQPSSIYAENMFDRWFALGGTHNLEGNKGSREFSPSFAQTWTQTAQARCRLSVKKVNSPLFSTVTIANPSSTHAAEIRANISYLYLRLLGWHASDDDVNRMFDSVFLPLESSANLETAWTGVCSTLLRDPRFFMY